MVKESKRASFRIDRRSVVSTMCSSPSYKIISASQDGKGIKFSLSPDVAVRRDSFRRILRCVLGHRYSNDPELRNQYCASEHITLYEVEL